jgi:hypothetical protein
MTEIPAPTAALAATTFVILAVAMAGEVYAQGSGAERTAEAVLSTRAQAPRSARPRTRIRVAPAYPYRTYSTDYPVPYKYEYPGPGFVRQCASWLAPENRISGPVIVPQMRCWWQRG